MRHVLASIAIWMGLFDWLASRYGLRGLSWGWGASGPLLALAGVRARPGIGALLGGLAPALLLHVGLATLRQRELDPKRGLWPARHRDRLIERIDIAGAHGPIPALHIVPAGGAEAAVCVAHGSGCDKTFYAWRLVEALTEHGLAVLLIDLDGHGESPRPQSYPEISECVAAPARWLRARYGRVALLGMSLGGAVAAHAVAEGAPCDALALWAPAPAGLRLSADEYRRVQIREALRIARPTLIHLFRDGSPYHVLRSWQTNGIRARIGTWDLFDALDTLGSLGRVGANPGRPPLLLVYAGRDGVLPRGAAEDARSATAGWARFHLVRRASHVSLPIEPETIGLTGAWLATTLASREKPGTP